MRDTKAQKIGPDNVPCRSCGDDRYPLHYNRLCPACYDMRPAVELSDALTEDQHGDLI